MAAPCHWEGGFEQGKCFSNDFRSLPRKQMGLGGARPLKPKIKKVGVAGGKHYFGNPNKIDVRIGVPRYLFILELGV